MFDTIVQKFFKPSKYSFSQSTLMELRYKIDESFGEQTPHRLKENIASMNLSNKTLNDLTSFAAHQTKFAINRSKAQPSEERRDALIQDALKFNVLLDALKSRWNSHEPPQSPQEKPMYKKVQKNVKDHLEHEYGNTEALQKYKTQTKALEKNVTPRIKTSQKTRYDQQTHTKN